MPEKKPRRILLVEDEDNMRDICRTILIEEGFGVDTAVNGMDALDKLERSSVNRSSFDLVITDVDMPELDGISLYVYAMKKYPLLRNRFIFMTGTSHFDEDNRSVISNMGGITIQKPFAIEKLLKQINGIMAIPIGQEVPD